MEVILLYRIPPEKDPDNMLERCSGKTKDGARCKNYPQPGRLYPDGSEEFRPTCSSHHKQKIHAAQCSHLQRGRTCGRLFKWTPGHHILCAEHLYTGSCPLIWLAPELMAKILHYLLPSEIIVNARPEGSSTGVIAGLAIDYPKVLPKYYSARDCLKSLGEVRNGKLWYEVKRSVYLRFTFTIDITRNGTWLCGRRIVAPRRESETRDSERDRQETRRTKRLLETFNWRNVHGTNIDILIESFRTGQLNAPDWNEEIELKNMRDYVLQVTDMLRNAYNLKHLNIRVGVLNFTCGPREYQNKAAVVLYPLVKIIPRIDNPYFLGIFDCSCLEFHRVSPLGPASAIPLPVKIETPLIGPEWPILGELMRAVEKFRTIKAAPSLRPSSSDPQQRDRNDGPQDRRKRLRTEHFGREQQHRPEARNFRQTDISSQRLHNPQQMRDGSRRNIEQGLAIQQDIQNLLHPPQMGAILPHPSQDHLYAPVLSQRLPPQPLAARGSQWLPSQPLPSQPLPSQPLPFQPYSSELPVSNPNYQLELHADSQSSFSQSFSIGFNQFQIPEVQSVAPQVPSSQIAASPYLGSQPAAPHFSSRLAASQVTNSQLAASLFPGPQPAAPHSSFLSAELQFTSDQWNLYSHTHQGSLDPQFSESGANNSRDPNDPFPL